jgi:hypothetical protein
MLFRGLSAGTVNDRLWVIRDGRRAVPAAHIVGARPSRRCARSGEPGVPSRVATIDHIEDRANLFFRDPQNGAPPWGIED